MKILVIDGQGGGVGRSLVEKIAREYPEAVIVAVGTNANATANMLKGGSIEAATGENAVIYNCERTDLIIGPIGIIMANAMMGEITPAMARAVSSSKAKVVLIPLNQTHAFIAGLKEKKVTEYIEDAIELIGDMVWER
ncbi:MAG: DUF3842 family protein [Lachnospiraceae bacterium]